MVGGIWVLSWLILAAASHLPGLAATLFVTTFGIFAVGETMYAPVLNPLTASLAPSGMVGTTLGVFGAIQTSGSAVGPLLAGVALNAGHGTVFIVAHVLISLVAVLAALAAAVAGAPAPRPARRRRRSRDDLAPAAGGTRDGAPRRGAGRRHRRGLRRRRPRPAAATRRGWRGVAAASTYPCGRDGRTGVAGAGT